MLINAQSPEELRIALVAGSNLESYQVEVEETGLTRGNIYRGLIAGIQPALNAAFIEYGVGRHGFLPIQDVVEEAYYRQPSGRPRIEEVLEKGKPIVVQVARDPEGQKGAALTTNLSLAGRYLVLTPFDDMRGVSRKVEDEEVRRELKQLAAKLEVPPGCGVIVRTNALDQNRTALARDLTALLRLWKRVQTEAMAGKGTKLLYSDQDLILKALRDYLDSSVEEVLVDDDAAFEKAEGYMRAFMPRAKTRLERYTDRLPLFARYGVESQIDRIYERIVPLPSGGSIVIDGTEALTAIDVNSGRATRGASQEETALQTNLEAAAEVARQLRLRDIGGLVVVDFIDMRASKYQRKVEKALKDAMKADKARSTVGRISPNGLLEVNRQRIQQALKLRTHRACPTCGGTGRIASPEMVGLSLLRRIEARAATGRIERARIALHPELADAFQNGRRQEIAALEREFGIKVEVIASPSLHRPDEEVRWIEREGGYVPPQPKVQPKPKAPAIDSRELALPEPAAEPRPAAKPKTGAPPAAAPAEKRARKRRRGGRKHKRPGENGEASAGNEAQEVEEGFEGFDEEAPEPREPTPEGQPQAAGEGAGKPKKRRRSRRGGRRRSGDGSGEGEARAEGGGTDGGTEETPAAPDAATPESAGPIPGVE